MVEVFILQEPLVSDSLVPVVPESLVNWIQVLHATLHGDEGVGRLENGAVAESNAHWIPSLLDFWVGISGDAQVLVNSFN